jgi:hypothetical protein
MIFEETMDAIMVKYYRRFKPMIEALNTDDEKIMKNLAFVSDALIRRNPQSYKLALSAPPSKISPAVTASGSRNGGRV